MSVCVCVCVCEQAKEEKLRQQFKNCYNKIE